MSDTLKTVLIDGGPPIALSDVEARFVYNILPIGEFHDKRYGRVSITPEKVKQMTENFGKYPSYEVPVKIGHEQGAKSPGKIIAAEAKPEGLEITMMVDAETAEAINKKQYRYMSAEFDEGYHSKETGENVGAVLLGAALVNQPGHPYVAPLMLIDNIPNEGSNEEPNEGKVDSMSELEDLKLQLSDLKAQKKQLESDIEAKNKELADEREKSAEERNKAAKETEETAKKLADLEASNKALVEERDKMEAARNEAEVKVFCETWTAQGVPPAVVDMVKPLLLAKQSRTIKLGDDADAEKPTIKFFDELFEAMPKVPLEQKSLNDGGKVELSDVEKAIARGQAIADSANQ